MIVSSARGRELTSWRLFVIAALPLFALYLATATWTTPYNIDALTNVLTAWEIATDGDVYLEDHEVLAAEGYRGTAAWIVPAKDSAAAQYPPGTAILAVPLYEVLPGQESLQSFGGASSSAPEVELPVPPIYQAALVSSAAAAVTVGLLALSFRRIVGGRLALVGAYVAGLATGIWSVAADSLWQHGPAMMWIAAGTLLSAHNQIGSGLAFGAAILTRPHTALVAACNGLWQSWQQRTPRPVVLIGIGAATGLAVLVAYNNAVFGSPSITGGYGGSFSTRATSLDLLDYLGNVLLSLVHPVRGLLLFSPFLVMLIPGIPAAWRAAPAWARGSAVGGLLYLLLQLKANRYSGGEGFWGYRYPLEALAAGAPLLMLAYSEWVRSRSSLVQRIFRYLVVGSVALTAMGAVYFSSFWAGPSG